jgi:hypothetical protein
VIHQTFTKSELDQAIKEWGCNCGPAALAFAAQTSLDRARRAIPGFNLKGFTNPSMMQTGLRTLGVPFERAPSLNPADLAFDGLSLVRVQFTGPWTKPGAPVRAAYQHTHWIATWMRQVGEQQLPFAFDVNSGFTPFRNWHDETLPLLVKNHPRRDGGWRPTHIWRMLGVAR